MSTKDDLLSHLRREALTINELAARLNLSRNAIVLPLRQLAAEGLVAGTTRREKRAGKPSLEYRAVAGQEDVASSAYPAFAELLMETLPDQFSSDQIERLMTDIGGKMAGRLDTQDQQDFETRLKTATDFADELGAETTVEAGDQSITIRSYSCPLARAVRREPCVCRVMAAFFAAATGGQVEEQCDRSRRLSCKFVVTQ